MTNLQSNVLRGTQRLLVNVASILLAGALPGPVQAQTSGAAAEAAKLFEPIRIVFQHPRCQNCHIPGDRPLQFNDGKPHAQNVQRGTDGKGVPAMMCSTCHQTQNLPASYGSHVPPGAPHWALPRPEHKMVFIDLTPAELCAAIKDKNANGGRDLAALTKHVSSDRLVAWGWNPGAEREPVPIPKDEFVAKFRQWVAAGAPCPGK